MKNLILIILLLAGSLVACRFESDGTDKNSSGSDQKISSNKDQEDDAKDKEDDDTNDIDKNDDNEDNAGAKIKSLVDKSFFNGKNKPVSVDILKEMFPIQLQGLIRSNLTGDHVGAFGFKMSTVKAVYKRNDQEIKFEVIDFGGLTSVLSEVADWSDSDLSHEDEDGFAKVDEWHGYKSFEKSDVKHNESSIAFIYKDRLIVNVQGDQQSLNDLKYITEKNILSKLDHLDLPTTE